MCNIPRAMILPKLAAGAVRITFAQLRAATPEIFFHADGDRADAKVLLPLDSVLRQMKPPVGKISASRRSRSISHPSSPRLSTGPPGAPRLPRSGARSSAVPEAAATEPSGPHSPSAKAYPWTDCARRQRRGKPDAPSPAQPSRPSSAAPMSRPHPLPRSRSPSSQRQSPRPRPRWRPRSTPPRPRPSTGGAGLLLALPLCGRARRRCRQRYATALQRLPPSRGSAGVPFISVGGNRTADATGKLLFKWSQLRGWCGGGPPAQARRMLRSSCRSPAVVPLFLPPARRRTPGRRSRWIPESRMFSESRRTCPAPPPARGTRTPPPPSAPRPAGPRASTTPATPAAPDTGPCPMRPRTAEPARTSERPAATSSRTSARSMA